MLLGLTWLMVYRTEKYQKLKAEVEKQSKKCEFIHAYGILNIYNIYRVSGQSLPKKSSYSLPRELFKTL